MIRRVLGAGFASVLLASALNPGPVFAQQVEQLGLACSMSGGLSAPCLGAAVASRSLAGQVGLLAGLGSAVPGTASNLGTRVGGGPRFTFFGRFGGLKMGAPDLRTASGTSESSFSVSVLQAGAVVGLFDGFRLMPTVGGFLSTDVIGQVSVVRLPTSDGFDGGATAFSLGLRLGVFREGFTIPGVSVSVARRFVPEYRFGATGSDASATVNADVTSVRATVGKDLFAVEFLGGVGWDDYSGDAALRVTDGVGGFAAVAGDVDGSRLLYFGSATMTFSIVLSITVEGGWARGLDPVPTYSGEHDPAAGSAFGSLALRLNM